MNRVDKAAELFLEGFNCSQSVFTAFCDRFRMDEETAKRVSAGLGGGVGRMREVCGALSGLFMLLGLKEGYSNPKDTEGKKELYSKVQELAQEFREEFGSIICKELLGINQNPLCKDPNPTPRTEKILAATPMDRFGEPEELIGTLLWLLNDEASGFVDGVVVPVDGGFSAYSGV